MGNAPLRRSKSATVGDSQHKCQTRYREAEGTSDTSLVPRKQFSSKTFSLRVSKLSAFIQELHQALVIKERKSPSLVQQLRLRPVVVQHLSYDTQFPFP
ncbi:hypothetical protein AVEN_255390-1 [Araneus ventricosus]|uniref:Uncharacterized protein n=1 Tax=Araneus ventricosus TaxID=182803 RepID=A0A4Y2HTW0_ARAVE|nr:hypothetical protein AVEN_255390-1 [Araneus ventricosus]